MMDFRTLLLALAIFDAASAQTYSHGICNPQLKTAQNFNHDKFIGDWHIVKKSYDLFVEGTKCYTASFNPNNGSGFDITDSFVVLDESPGALGYGALLLGKRRHDNERLEIQYSAHSSDDDLQSGKFYLKPGLTGDTQSFWVLDTDYDNYTATYSCTNAHDGKVEYVWIAARKPRPDLATLAKAEKCLRSRNIKLPLISVEQSCAC